MPGFKVGGQGSGPSNTVDGKDFHRKHRWRISSLGIPSSNSQSQNQSSLGQTRERGGGPNTGSGATSKALWAQSLQLPGLEFTEEQIKSPSMVYKVVSKAKWKNCVVKFYDVWGLFEEFEAWQQKIWTPGKGIQPAIDYKGEPIFELLDGEGNVKQSYTLKGAYPLFIDHGELTYESSGVKILSVTYSYDYAEVEFK